jgi:hypothetical protein
MIVRTGWFVPFFVCGIAAAQLPPGRKATQVGAEEDFNALGASSRPGSVFASFMPPVDEVQQIRALANLDAAGAPIPGQFQLCLTVVRAGSTLLMLGVLDTTANPWRFTENTATLLPGVNVTGYTSGSMTSDLLVFCCDGGQTALWSTRASRSVPFQPLVDGGRTSPTDVHLFTTDGVDALAYSHVPGGLSVISESDINRAKYPLPPQIAPGFGSLVVPPFLDVHAPGFLYDSSNNARAVIHSTDMGGPGSGIRARPWLSGNVTTNGNTDPTRQFFTGPNDDTEMEHAGALAGSTLYPTKPPGGRYEVPKLIRIVASSGSRVPPAGGVFRLSAWGPFFAQTNPPPQPWAITILVGVPANDLTVPGFRGKLALALSPAFLALPARTWTVNTLSADWVVPAPALPSGTRLWTQTLAYDPAGAFGPGDFFYFGNTSGLIWQ